MRYGSRSRAMYSKPDCSSTRAIFCPTRPKPQMTTWSRSATASVAGSSRMVRFAEAPLAQNVRVMRRLWRMISGDSTMLSTVAASSGCTMAGSSNSSRSNSVSSAKPNSPPCETITPVRKDLNQLPVAGLATSAPRPPSTSSMPTRIAVTSGRCRSSRPTSSSMPTVMKNRPRNTSR
jgi:hypothetical protein